MIALAVIMIPSKNPVDVLLKSVREMNHSTCQDLSPEAVIRNT